MSEFSLFDDRYTVCNSGVFFCQPLLYQLGAEISSPYVPPTVLWTIRITTKVPACRNMWMK